MANPLAKKRGPHTPWNSKAERHEDRGCGLNSPDETDPRTGKPREKFCTCGNNPVGPDDYRRINLPRAFWGATLEGVQEDNRTGVKKFLDRVVEARERGAGGYIYGPISVGKTGIGALIMIEARAWGFTAYCITVSALRDAIRDRKAFDAEMSIYERCRTVDFLLLDDLTALDFEEKYNFTKGDIRNLVCNRKDRGLVTIVTSRLSLFELDKLDRSFSYDIAVKCLAPFEVKGEPLPVETDLFK
jgi:hypothetical protein